MNSINRFKTTKMFWQQRQNSVVRFERDTIEHTALVLGETSA